MDRLFLDANVLFSAAYREDSGLRELWNLTNVELVSSAYAFEESRRNLADSEKVSRLQVLVKKLAIVPESDVALPDGVTLREKHQPIVRAAVASKATHLITGDRRDFGRYFGKRISGISVMTLRQYLESET